MKNLPYLELYNLLKQEFASAEREINIPALGIKITRSKFHSKGAAVLPGRKSYYCPKHNKKFPGETTYEGPPETGEGSILHTHDSEFTCNEDFEYIIINNIDQKAVKKGSLSWRWIKTTIKRRNLVWKKNLQTPHHSDLWDSE